MPPPPSPPSGGQFRGSLRHSFISRPPPRFGRVRARNSSVLPPLEIYLGTGFNVASFATERCSSTMTCFVRGWKDGSHEFSFSRYFCLENRDTNSYLVRREEILEDHRSKSIPSKHQLVKWNISRIYKLYTARLLHFDRLNHSEIRPEEDRVPFPGKMRRNETGISLDAQILPQHGLYLLESILPFQRGGRINHRTPLETNLSRDYLRRGRRGGGRFLIWRVDRSSYLKGPWRPKVRRV